MVIRLRETSTYKAVVKLLMIYSSLWSAPNGQGEWQRQLTLVLADAGRLGDWELPTALPIAILQGAVLHQSPVTQTPSADVLCKHLLQSPQVSAQVC